MSIDTLITSVPWTDTDSPIMAPAVLKSCLLNNNFSAAAIDLNAEVRELVIKSSNKASIIKFFTTEQVDSNAIEDITQIFNLMVDRILEYNPKWVALSLLTYSSQHATKWLCFCLREKNPNIKIVVGGPGCFNTLKSIDTYISNLKSSKLVDHYITGDGERSIVELLKGNVDYPGIDSTTWKALSNLDELPVPDYGDYKFSLYKVKKLGIWGSRGCVRDCTFCDIHEHWEKFQWRSAESIVNEMIDQHKKYGFNIFHFADSLVNGNQKEYRKFIRLLSEYNSTKHDSEKIKWSGFFIFRPKDQMREEDWQYTAESGAIVLNVGVESFVEHIRYHLKKYFSNDDLDYGIQMAKKYKIGLALLIIVGYVTESDSDHKEQIEWLVNNRHYANDPVIEMSIGSTLAILPGTWLHRHHKELGITLSSSTIYQDWTNEAANNTPATRLSRHKEVETASIDNGFFTFKSMDNHVLIENYIKRKYYGHD